MKDYFREWLHRAVVGALQAVGFEGRTEAVRTVVLWVLSVLVLYSVDWRRVPFVGADDPGASSEVRLGLSALVGILVVFALTFLWQLIVKPAEMADERRHDADRAVQSGREALDRQSEEARRREEKLKARIAELKDDIAAMLDAEQLLQRLSTLQRDGRALYDREADPAVWSQRMNDWNSEVESIIRANFSISDVHRFQSRQMAPPYATSWSWAGDEDPWPKRLYSSRLENLDDLIRFGQPVNFARSRLANGATIRAALDEAP